MPGLEDELGDIVRKARTGQDIAVEALAATTGLAERDLKATEVYTFRPDEAQVRRLAAALALDADRLWDIARDSWSAPDVPWRIGSEVTVDCLTNDYPEHCYVVTGPAGECLIVDPGDEADRVVGEATRDGRRPVGILVTHGHQDHTGAVVPVQRETGAPVYVHEADAQSVSGVPAAAVRTFAGDADLRAGSFAVRALHVPGHTAGSSAYVLSTGGETAAFCGDTLFAGSAGNARAGYSALLASLREKLARLPDGTVFYPGHGPATTLANERQRNPFL